MHMQRVLWISSVFAVATCTAVTNPSTYTIPECNTARFRAGCLLDVLEKACESVKDLERCGEEPSSCRTQEEFPGELSLEK